MSVFWDLCHVVWKKLTDISEVLTASIIRLMSQSISVRLHNATMLEDSHLHTHHHENLKSHLVDFPLGKTCGIHCVKETFAVARIKLYVPHPLEVKGKGITGAGRG
jgi:hypothetical protein